jgi:ribosome biogenesis GTPase A
VSIFGIVFGIRKWVHIDDPTKTFKNKDFKLVFDFPGIVKANKAYNGKILYNGVLDSITTKFNVEPGVYPQRYVLYRYTILPENLYNKDTLTAPATDTLSGIEDCNTVPIFDTKFKKPGVYYFDGWFEDRAFTSKIVGKDTLERPIGFQFRLVYKVYVK